MKLELAISIISAATALLAVVIGPYVTLKVAKRQILGPMRLAWTNDLRSTLAEFHARISVGWQSVASALTDDEALRHQAKVLRAAHVQATTQLLSKIVLLLNPNVVEHEELVRLAKGGLEAYIAEENRTVVLAALQKQAQLVLKLELIEIKK